jgi:predicted dehydrogenase
MSFAHMHADAYLAALQTLPGVRLIGVADEDHGRAHAAVAGTGVPVYASYEALLAEQPQAVVVCSENSKHRPLVELAAAHGAHVLCEKPLATTLADAEAMIAACREAGVILMTAFPMRFSAPLVEVKARLDAGDFGEVFCFNGVNQGELPSKHRAWFVDPELAGGGALIDHTVHLLDIMRWYTGREPVEVYAQTNRIFHHDEVEVETGALVLLTFDDGTFATIDASWSRPPYWPAWGGLGFEMVTARGAVLVDAFKQNLTVYAHDLGRPVWTYWGSDANAAMLDEFLAAVREGRPPAVTGLDGLAAVRVALAAAESARTGQPVKLIP